VPAADALGRRGRDHRHGAGRDDGQRTRVPLRAAAQRVAGLGAGQYSSGGKTRLGRITKAGDAYLRSLLMMGPGRCCMRPRTRPTASAAGRCNWPSARLLASRRGHRGEERAHGLGGAQPRRAVRHAGLSDGKQSTAPTARGGANRLIHRRVTASVDASRLDLYGECLFSSRRRLRSSSANE
jgi:hypothetical protein